MKELGRIAREGEAPRDDAEARELLRPFSPEELEAMTAGAARELLVGEEGTSKKTASTTPARPEPTKAEGPAKAKARARWGGPVTIGAFVLAAAAAALFWLRTPPTQPAPLASYDLVIEGSERPSRSGDPTPGTEEPVRVRRDGRLVFLARPRTPLTAGTSASAAAMVARGEALTAWHVVPQVSAEGAVRIEAAATALAELPDGSSRVVIFVGPPAALPKGDEAGRTMRRAPPPEIQVLEREIIVVAQ